MPRHLWEFPLYHLVCSPSSLEGKLAAPACPSPSPPSSIILASLETPSEKTCSRFTSVSLVLNMAWKRLCPDGSNGALAKRQKKQPGSSARKTQPTTPKSSDTGHHGDSAHKNKRIGLLYSRLDYIKWTKWHTTFGGDPIFLIVFFVFLLSSSEEELSL